MQISTEQKHLPPLNSYPQTINNQCIHTVRVEYNFNTIQILHAKIKMRPPGPLPPIFSSELCRISPKNGILSGSHPGLASFCWHQPNTNFRDALNKQYDRSVKEFYFEERERLIAMKQSKGHSVIHTLEKSSDSSSAETDSNLEDF